MSYSRGVWILFLFIFLSPGFVYGGDFNKNIPLKIAELSDYNGEQLFAAAYQAYICSFLMHLAGQKEKGQLLRFYSVKLMQEDSVKKHGKSWNDVNFPGGLSAMTLADEYSKWFNVPLSNATRRLLKNDPQCQSLNRFTVQALEKRKQKAPASHVSASDAQDTWQIKKFKNLVRYITHGTMVHGHRFGFVMQSGQCEVDELWLSWSTHEPQVVKLIGSEVVLLTVVDGKKFKIRANIETAQKYFPGSLMTIAHFGSFTAGPEFIDLLNQGKKIEISISGSASKFFDLPNDEFSLTGFTRARQQAKVICEERAA